MEADLIVTCPYNSAHRIRKSKLNNHMVKCKKTSVLVNKTACPLNCSSIVDTCHLREHIASCKNLGNIVQDVELGQGACSALPMAVESYPSYEDWNKDPEVPSYNPMVHSAEKKVLRTIPGLSRGEKKKFRENERMRLASLKEIGTATPPVALDETERSVSFPSIAAGFTKKEIPKQDEPVAKVPDFNISVHNQSTDKYDEFQKTLYNELVSECEDTDICEEMKRSFRSDANASVKNDSRRIFGKENLSTSVQDQKAELTSIQVDANCEMFHFGSAMKESNALNASGTQTADAHNQDANKLSAMLKRNLDGIKIDPATEMKKTDKETDENLTWDEIFSTFNERLAHLTDIQNAAAEESARLLKQLKDLKLHQDSVPKK